MTDEFFVKEGMTPQQAQERYGATHYMPMLDGVTPQMYYRRHRTPVNDGTVHEGWQYLTFAYLWHNSGNRKEDLDRLIEISPTGRMIHGGPVIQQIPKDPTSNAALVAMPRTPEEVAIWQKALKEFGNHDS